MNQLPWLNEDVSMNTPARAVKNTNNIPKMSATGMPARLPRNLVIPAAADPTRVLWVITPAAMGRSASKGTHQLLFFSASRRVSQDPSS
jgi:hypothetical protein